MPKRALSYVNVGGDDWEYVAPSATNQVFGNTGSFGDYIARVVVNVTTSATGNVQIKDGTDGAITIVPANTPIGVYTVELGIRSKAGPWQITTGAGASAFVVGQSSV